IAARASDPADFAPPRPNRRAESRSAALRAVTATDRAADFAAEAHHDVATAGPAGPPRRGSLAISGAASPAGISYTRPRSTRRPVVQPQPPAAEPVPADTAHPAVGDRYHRRAERAEEIGTVMPTARRVRARRTVRVTPDHVSDHREDEVVLPERRRHLQRRAL